MALFVDLDDEAEPPSHHLQQYDVSNFHGNHGNQLGWNGGRVKELSAIAQGASGTSGESMQMDPAPPREDRNRNAMTEALGCYPIASTIASSLDLIALDHLSQTCRAVRSALMQYRSSLKARTLRCVNEDVEIDPEDTFRYRARAGNWYYMVEDGRDRDYYNGKSGSCARDMVAECRRCGTVVCRNCAIKPPAPIVLRDRHRRLCIKCTKVPIALLAKPPLLANTPIDADVMKRAMCTCQSEGVWLCQPCGRSIRTADHEYKSIWKWRSQYGEVLGSLGVGIGDGDRGVICGRDSECCNARDQEHETDCDAQDARLLESSGTPPPWAPPSPESSDGRSTRTPSPKLGAGYARHEIEGIGGVVKKKLVSMVKIGACVPEWEDEKNRGEILGREVSGRTRSWCGWCWRVIPGKKDYENVGVAKSNRIA